MVEYERLLLFVAVVLLSVEQVVSDVAADKDGRVLFLTNLEHPDIADTVAALVLVVTVAVVVLVDKDGASSCKVVGAPTFELLIFKASSFEQLSATVRRLLSSLLQFISSSTIL